MIKFYQDRIKSFSSVHDFLEYMECPKLAPGRDEETVSSQDEARRFTYNTTWDNTIKYARNGWPDGLKKMTDGIQFSPAKGPTPKWSNSVSGAFPNVGRYLAGQPDCMHRRVISIGQKQPIVDIHVNSCYSSRTPTSKPIRFGVALVSMIDALETAGFRVGVTCHAIGQSLRQNSSVKRPYGISVEVKSPNDPVELSDMVFFLAHPNFLRRFFFRHVEKAISSNDHPINYGSPQALRLVEEFQPLFNDKRTIVINDYEDLPNVRDVWQAVEHFNGLLEHSHPELVDAGTVKRAV